MTSTCAIDEAGREVSAGGRPLVPWWSFGKTVVATAALRLVEYGAFALDTALPGAAYTLRQLLRHEAGLPDYGALPAYHQEIAEGGEPWPSAEMLARVGAAFPAIPPGEAWAYSNIGYVVLGGYLEAATGKKLEAIVADEVFGPAGIRSARFARHPDDLRGVAMHIGPPYHPGWVYPGLIVGALRDAALLLHRLLNVQLLGPTTLHDMMQARALPQFRGPVWQHPGYALGLMRAGLADGSVLYGHTGEGLGSAIAIYGMAGAGGWRVAAAWSHGVPGSAVEETVVNLLRPCSPLSTVQSDA